MYLQCTMCTFYIGLIQDLSDTRQEQRIYIQEENSKGFNDLEKSRNLSLLFILKVATSCV